MLTTASNLPLQFILTLLYQRETFKHKLHHSAPSAQEDFEIQFKTTEKSSVYTLLDNLSRNTANIDNNVSSNFLGTDGLLFSFKMIQSYLIFNIFTIALWSNTAKADRFWPYPCFCVAYPPHLLPVADGTCIMEVCMLKQMC